jgi:hypothetical protein
MALAGAYRNPLALLNLADFAGVETMRFTVYLYKPLLCSEPRPGKRV